MDQKSRVADRTRIVQDPNTGVNRQIIAGQAIPPDLVNAVEGPSVVDCDYAPEGDSRAETVEGNELSKLTRDELNEVAVQESIENPEGFATKGELVEAIEAARGE